MEYNPLKSILIVISSLKLSTVPYAAGSESRGHSRITYMAIYRCQTASQVSLFVRFLISWISLPTKTTKIDTPRLSDFTVTQLTIWRVGKVLVYL